MGPPLRLFSIADLHRRILGGDVVQDPLSRRLVLHLPPDLLPAAAGHDHIELVKVGNTSGP